MMEETQTDAIKTQEVAQIPENIGIRILCGENRELHLPQVNTGETLHAIKAVLADFQETVFITAFHLDFRYCVDENNNHIEKSVGEYGDYSVLSTFVDTRTKECVFAIDLDAYDLKQLRFHVKRIRDLCLRSHLSSIQLRKQSIGNAQENGSERDRNPTTDSEGESSGEVAVPITKKAQPQQKSEAKSSADIPRMDAILGGTTLQQYLHESLCLTPSKVSSYRAQDAVTLRHVIKSVHFSGWNPPPAHRKMQGDLLYLEVILLSEGTMFITCTSRGFYLNKSNRGHFDPAPATNSHFSHELFKTIFGFSAAVRSAWSAIAQASKAYLYQQAASTGSDDHLESIARQYVNMNIDPTTIMPGTWILPSIETGAETALFTSRHDYNVARVQDDLVDLRGIDEMGAPREWNEEIQSIRSLRANDFNEKILKARLEFRITVEFADCVKRIVLAIADGLMAPLSIGTPGQGDIYVYNGIFISRAEDTKDTFKICETDESARRINTRDLYNQKFIRSLEIEGVSAVLCAIVDFKGIRYVGQSIIPGILTQGVTGARLMYGLMELEKSLTVKNTSLATMKVLGEKLSIPVRNVSIHPFGQPVADSSANKAATVDTDPMNRLLLSSEEASAPIRVDDIDDVPVDSDTQTVPHVGPIEGKMVEGTDGRVYLLEIMRLTPIDANYVPLSSGGTGKINEELLTRVDKNNAHTYILRQELVVIYLQRRLIMERQALLAEINARKKEEMAKLGITESTQSPAAAEKASATVKEVDTAGDEADGEDEGNLKIVKDEPSADNKLSVDEAIDESLANEFGERFRAITIQSLGVEINPNVFIPGMKADADDAVIAKDEETARDIARLLWDVMLPLLVRQVRECDFTPRDADSLVDYLHRQGINVRYIGQIAQLSMEEEREDLELGNSGKQRINSMPSYFYDMLLIEMIARGVKHILNNAMRKDKSLTAAPAQTIATILNHLLSILHAEDGAAEAVTASTVKAGGKPVVDDHGAAGDADKKQKKKKKKASTKNSSAQASDYDQVIGTEMLTAIDIFPSKLDFLRQLKVIIEERFLYTVPLLKEGEDDLEDIISTDNSTEALNKKLHSKTFLRTRIAPAQLLRRVCQQSGIVIAAKAYDYKAEVVFKADDIITLVPKIKSCEPNTYLPEYQDCMHAATSLVQSGETLAAYEAAQHASGMINQITDSAHLHGYPVMDLMTSVLADLNDVRGAAITAGRTLSLSMQVRGLDCEWSAQQHVRVATYEMELGNLMVAFLHLKAALHTIQLTGGDRHPEAFNIFYRFSLLYDKAKDYESSIQCLLRASLYAHDLTKQYSMNVVVAEVLHRNGHSADAVNYQKIAYKVYKAIHGDADDRVQSIKKGLEVYLRASSGSFSSSSVPIQFVKPEVFHRNSGATTDLDTMNLTAEPPSAEGDDESGDKEGSKKKKRSSHKKSKAKK